VIPKKISIKENKNLNIIWDNETLSEINLAKLRKECPCATCLSEKEKNGRKYIPLFNGDQIAVAKIEMVGHYAVGITWKDGHNTGIYEFKHLLKLAN